MLKCQVELTMDGLYFGKVGTDVKLIDYIPMLEVSHYTCMEY
jgi:hypothetical protein